MPENHILVVRGFDVFTRVTAPLVQKALKAHCGVDWWKKCVLGVLHDHQKRGLPSAGTDEDLAQSLDAGKALILIDQHWNSIFKEMLGFDARNWIKEALGDRNKAAHRGVSDLQSDDSWRMLDTLRRIVARVDVNAANQLTTLRDSCAPQPRGVLMVATALRNSPVPSRKAAPAASADPTPHSDVWTRVQRLRPGQQIRNWTRAKGYFGQDFTIRHVSSRSIQIEAPGAKSLQNIPAKDFDVVGALWQDYVSDKVGRAHFLPLTRFSKYVISILHHLYEQPR